MLACCSDGGNPSEVHAADVCFLLSSGLLSDGAAPSTAYTCELDLPCTNGWSLYVDDGSEGTNSCLQIYTSAVTGWALANTGCPVGTHLLSIRGATSSSLMVHTQAGMGQILGSGRPMWVGCSQSPTATQRARGWSWVDGTPDGNLNCGSGNGGGDCSSSVALWRSGEPK